MEQSLSLNNELELQLELNQINMSELEQKINQLELTKMSRPYQGKQGKDLWKENQTRLEPKTTSEREVLEKTKSETDANDSFSLERKTFIKTQYKEVFPIIF